MVEDFVPNGCLWKLAPKDQPSWLKFMISDESIRLLWDGLALKLEHLAAPRRLPHGFLEATLRQFGDEGFDLFEDVFTCVTASTARAGKHTIVLSISRTFNRYATNAAKNALGIGTH